MKKTPSRIVMTRKSVVGVNQVGSKLFADKSAVREKLPQGNVVCKHFYSDSIKVELFFSGKRL